jgi:hypothetical protein
MFQGYADGTRQTQGTDTTGNEKQDRYYQFSSLHLR